MVDCEPANWWEKNSSILGFISQQSNIFNWIRFVSWFIFVEINWQLYQQNVGCLRTNELIRQKACQSISIRNSNSVNILKAWKENWKLPQTVGVHSKHQLKLYHGHCKSRYFCLVLKFRQFSMKSDPKSLELKSHTSNVPLKMNESGMLNFSLFSKNFSMIKISLRGVFVLNTYVRWWLLEF